MHVLLSKLYVTTKERFTNKGTSRKRDSYGDRGAEIVYPREELTNERAAVCPNPIPRSRPRVRARVRALQGHVPPASASKLQRVQLVQWDLRPEEDRYCRHGWRERSIHNHVPDRARGLHEPLWRSPFFGRPTTYPMLREPVDKDYGCNLGLSSRTCDRTLNRKGKGGPSLYQRETPDRNSLGSQRNVNSHRAGQIGPM